MTHSIPLIVTWVNAVLGPIVASIAASLGMPLTPDADGFVIPAHIVMSALIVLGFAVLGLVMRSRLSVENPGKFQIVLEDGLSALRGVVNEWIPGKGDKYLPLLVSVFLFILVSNYAGTVPGLMAPTSILSTTVGLAVTVWIYYHYQGIRTQGIVPYFLHFAAPPGAPIWMAPIMLPIELISHTSRVLSLSLRLFGNVFGEHLVVGVLASLVPLFVPLPMMLLGLVTGGLQAFIFMLLTTIYLAGAVAVEHHDEHEHHDAPHDDRVDVGRGHAAATA
jgi:F-type H+-transporting ATPase subunit a